MIACPDCRRLVRPVAACPFCGGAIDAAMFVPVRGPRRSRTAVLAALAGATAVACGGTVTAPSDASTPDDSGADAANDVTLGFDGGFKDAPAPQDAFVAQDGFCCPLYGGSPSP